VVSSHRCPGDLIFERYDLASALHDASEPVIGVWKPPMEKKCQRLLLRGSRPIVI